MKYVLLFICIICSKYTDAQTYEGTIGKHEIFLEIDLDDNNTTAFYFYKSYLKNIALEGTYSGTELILFERFSAKEEKKELFTLVISNDSFSGTWQNNDRQLKVALSETTTSIEQYKLQQLEFVRDSIATYDTTELVWFTEKYSKKALFRLGNGFTTSVREFVNQKLDSIHTNYALMQLDCDYADINIEIELVSNRYISFSEYASIYCGGAHPSHTINGYNLDLKNNIQLDKLTDVYPNLNHFQLLRNKYDDDPDLHDECEYFTSGEALWEYYSWVFTKNGITITPHFPHVLAPCAVGFTLTYEELQQNKN